MGRSLPNASFDATPFSGDSWTLIAEAATDPARHTPAVFALGNGFIGVRGQGDEENAPRVYLNGVFERVPITYHEAAHGYAEASDTRLGVADATAMVVTVDGTTIADAGRIELDLKRGILVETRTSGDVEVRLEGLVSMTRTAIVATRVVVRSLGAPARISVASSVTAPPFKSSGASEEALYDPRLGPDLDGSPWTNAEEIEGDRVRGRIDRLLNSGFIVAALASRVDRTFDLAAGDIVSVESFASYRAARGIASADVIAKAGTELASAQTAGFEALAAEQARWFADFWTDAHVALPDAPDAERAMRHALFQVVQAAGAEGANSVPAKGQTGEGYEGHVFWDAESYVLPLFVYTRPAIARGMLAWRISKLESARRNARAMGQARGALYPWRTIDGGECSSFFPAGSAQYHINADIAHALRLYVDTTGDAAILVEGGARMLLETARIWLEIGYHDPSRGDAFVINNVTGPDEYSALVDNNLFTNLMAAEHLRFAVSAASDLMDEDEAEAMLRASDMMHLPFDRERGIHAQDDGFFTREPWPFDATPANRHPLLLHYHPLTIYRHRVSKQADAVLAIAMLRDRFDREMRLRMLDAYEAVTVHDSTLSASAFAIAAANAGDPVRAYNYWRVSVLTDVSNLFGNSDHGLHMAALAGGWNALALGFGGLRTIGGKLSFAPIAVPLLGRYAFRVRFRGSVVELSADTTNARYRLVTGDAVEFSHAGEILTLRPGDDIERALVS